MTEETQKRLAERLGQLLAESPLDDATKEEILERLDQMTEADMFELHDVLKREREQITKIATQLQISNLEQEEDWQKVAKHQKTATDNLLNKHVRQAVDAKKLEELKV